MRTDLLAELGWDWGFLALVLVRCFIAVVAGFGTAAVVGQRQTVGGILGVRVITRLTYRRQIGLLALKGTARPIFGSGRVDR